MSDIDRTRMIPLHIADQAVAACDAEIAKLREENARLKAEVEAVRQEYSDATNHYNRLHNDLQAEVERLTKAGDGLCASAYLWKTDPAVLRWNAAKENPPHA